MKRVVVWLCSIVTLAALLSAASMTGIRAKATEILPDTFSCKTFDRMGNRLNGYWSETDRIWYLFVTSDQPVSDIVLHYSGDVSSVSAGELSITEKTVTNAFAKNGDALNLTMSCGTVHTVVIMQSELPSVHIKLNTTTLDEIHEDKTKKYPGNSFYLMDPEGVHDLTAEGTVEIKGRGNSTWLFFEKKAYQIKFSEETSVLGMEKAKKWVLLANASDDSLIRTKLVYDTVSTFGMEFVPEMEFVDLWIDGEYRGNFLIGEKVELDSSRLDLSSKLGALYEHDVVFYGEEEYWFYSEVMRRQFALKDIKEETPKVISYAMTEFERAVNNLAEYLFSTPSKEITLGKLSKMIDVDSFAKYYLINEYVLNSEAFVTSFYWYQDGPSDVLHLGPIWDFDTCLGNDGQPYDQPPSKESYLFRYLFAIPAFYERTMELWEAFRPELEAMADHARQLKSLVSDSARMNYKRWDVLGKPNQKGGVDFYATFEEAADAVAAWAEGRYSSFELPKAVSVAAAVSDDCYSMNLSYEDGKPHEKVEFAVWCLNEEPQKEFWYYALQNENGAWESYVDLAKHNSAGVYRIDVYTDGSREAETMGYAYVAEARAPVYHASAEVSDDSRVLTARLSDSKKCWSVSFAVWSDEGNQDDVQWYPALRNKEGIWEAKIPLELHETAGAYTIHAFSRMGGEWELVDYTKAEVPVAVSGLTRLGKIWRVWFLVSKGLKAAAILAAVCVPCVVIVFVVNYRRKKRRN